MTSPRRRSTCLLAVLALALLLAAGCSSTARPVAVVSAPPVVPSSTVETTAPTTTAVATPTGPAPLTVDPFTGVGPVPAGGVVAVKIDDTANGRPQRNITQADLVYIEQVEGGLTRLLAVYAANKPTVGSVRSVRYADPELLAQFGRITLVASGGAPAVMVNLDHADLLSSINDRSGPGFARVGCCAPYNVISNLAAVTSSVPGAAVKDVGLVWGALPAGVGTPAASLRTVVGGTTVAFAWDGGHWERVIGGVRQAQSDGAPVATANVIVQFCDVTVDNRDIDVAGNPSMYTHSVGSGPVAIFRDGVRIDGTWSRADMASGTVYRDAAGQPIPLAPGGAWVVLATKGAPLAVG